MTHSWDILKNYPDLVDGKWPTLPALFQIAVHRFPDRTCFSVIEKEKESYTSKEEYQEILKAAYLIKEAGLKKGDVVMVNGKNSREWATAYFAVSFAGCIVTPIDNQMKIERVAELGEFADVRFIFADDDVLDKLEALDNSWYKGLKGKISLKGKSDKYKRIYALSNPPLENPVSLKEDDIAAILFTSGTTGNEKGALLTHANITSDAYQAADGMGVDETDTLYALLPLHHSYCCTAVLMESVLHGAECLFGHGIVVSRMINDLKRGNVTVFMGIPLLYNKILAGIEKQIKAKGAFTNSLINSLMNFNLWCKVHTGHTPMKNFFNKMILSKLGLDHAKLLISGAGPLAGEVFRKYQALGLNFLQGYGLTETSPILTLNPPEHFKTDSVGKVFPFVDMIIADKDNDGVGEIRVKGDNICIGYLKDKEHTDELFDENGYLCTGDLGYIDEENYLFLKGRKKNLIVTEGGKNVYPEEIEDMFQLYSDIVQIHIRGFQLKPDVPSESIEAVIHPSDEYSKGKSKEEIESHINEIVSIVNKDLVGYKKIEKITILDKPMEVTTTQKIKRRTVKA